MVIEEQYDKIYRYCYFKLYDKQLAQDITQEAFLRFYRQGLRLDNGKELPYLYTIAKNLCIDELVSLFGTHFTSYQIVPSIYIVAADPNIEFATEGTTAFG